METVSYLHLASGQEPPSLGGPSPFKAVLVIEQPFTAEWQSMVSEWLVQAGCLYMMAWGTTAAVGTTALITRIYRPSTTEKYPTTHL